MDIAVLPLEHKLAPAVFKAQQRNPCAVMQRDQRFPAAGFAHHWRVAFDHRAVRVYFHAVGRRCGLINGVGMIDAGTADIAAQAAVGNIRPGRIKGIHPDPFALQDPAKNTRVLIRAIVHPAGEGHEAAPAGRIRDVLKDLRLHIGCLRLFRFIKRFQVFAAFGCCCRKNVEQQHDQQQPDRLFDHFHSASR